LRDAAQFILALPPAEQRETRWQAAASVLKMVAESGGDAMMARIGMMKALPPSRAGGGADAEAQAGQEFSDHRLNRKNPGSCEPGFLSNA
jgi:hypothetical protein